MTVIVNVSTSDQTRYSDVAKRQILVNSRQEPSISDQREKKGKKKGGYFEIKASLQGAYKL